MAKRYSIYDFAADYDLRFLSDDDLEALQALMDLGAPRRGVEDKAVAWNLDIKVGLDIEEARNSAEALGLSSRGR